MKNNKTKSAKTTNKTPHKRANNQTDKKGQSKKNGLAKSDLLKIMALVNKYTKYTNTDEYKAEQFVRENLKQATKNTIVEIISIDAPKDYAIGYQQFKTVECAIYKRSIKPEYPAKAGFAANDYELVCRAIDWDCAKTDIKTQKRKKVKCDKYKICGAMCLNREPRPPYFIKSAPDKIKALANDLNDRSNKLWDQAYKYFNMDYLDYDDFVYKIKSIEKLT